MKLKNLFGQRQKPTLSGDSVDERKPVATKADWEIEPMPNETTSFVLKRRFTASEIQNLRCGHIPEDMDDRWFCYFEEDKLYIHRSWSGICVYIIDFHFKSGKHTVTVNRNANQYTCTDLDEDKEELNTLIGFWC